MSHVNTDYFNAFIDDLQGEINDIEEQRDEYKSRMEDLECELKEANEAYEILLKENKELKDYRDKTELILYKALEAIRGLYHRIGSMEAFEAINTILQEADDEE